MSLVNPNTLKQYFQTGNVPTQSNFADLIDSAYNKLDGGLLSQGQLNIALTGTVSVSSGSPTLTGNSTTFVSQLKKGSAIQIGAQLYTLQSITSDTKATLTQNATVTQTSVTAFIQGALLSVQNYAQQIAAIITAEGNTGIGTATPSSKLEVSGDIKANTFIGSGAALTGITTDSITGEFPIARLSGSFSSNQLPAIPADKVSGTLNIQQLPPIPAANISGTLSLAQIPDLSSRTVLFYTDTPCINAGTRVTLNWIADSSYDLTLTYIAANQITTQHFKTTSGTQPGNTQISLTDDTLFTLTAKSAEQIVAQHQLQVCVLSAAPTTPVAYIRELKSQHVATPDVISQTATKFGYTTLNVANITALATALKQADYSPADIYQYLPAYYASTHQAMTPDTTNAMINVVGVPDSGAPAAAIEFAKQLYSTSTPISTAASQIAGNFGYTTLSVDNVSMLAKTLEGGGYDDGDIYKTVLTYFHIDPKQTSSIKYITALINAVGRQ